MTDYRSPWMDDDLELFRDAARRFVADEVVPNQARWASSTTSTARSGARRARWGCCARHAGRVRRPRRRRRARGGGGRGAGTARRHRLRGLGARDRRPLHPQPRHRGAEAALPAAAGERRDGRRDRDDRAGRRLRSAGGDDAARCATATTGSSTVPRPSSRTACSRTSWSWSPAPARRAGRQGHLAVLVETEGRAGYRVGRVLEKIGQKGQDTCELFFDDVPRAGRLACSAAPRARASTS